MTAVLAVRLLILYIRALPPLLLLSSNYFFSLFHC